MSVHIVLLCEHGATVQTCVVHLVRNSLRYASRKDWAAITRGLKTIYTAATLEAATVTFEEFAGRWREQYSATIRSWETKRTPNRENLIGRINAWKHILNGPSTTVTAFEAATRRPSRPFT